MVAHYTLLEISCTGSYVDHLTGNLLLAHWHVLINRLKYINFLNKSHGTDLDYIYRSING